MIKIYSWVAPNISFFQLLSVGLGIVFSPIYHCDEGCSIENSKIKTIAPLVSQTKLIDIKILLLTASECLYF